MAPARQAPTPALSFGHDHGHDPDHGHGNSFANGVLSDVPGPVQGHADSGPAAEICTEDSSWFGGLFSREQTPEVHGLDAYSVVPNDFSGTLGPDQLLQSEREELDAFGFGDFQVVGNDCDQTLTNDQMRQADYDALQRAWLNIDAGTGMNITGEDADQQAFKQMLRATLTDSPTFRGLLSSIGNDTDPEHLIQAEAGRSQPGVLWDSFASNAIDLDDFDGLAATPSPAHPNEITQGMVLTHFLAERQDAAIEGSAFPMAHQIGQIRQNDYRMERGQAPITSQLGDQRDDGGLDVSFGIHNSADHRFTFDATGAMTDQVRP